MRKDDDMTWKKFWKRVNALLHDNRTVLREGEDIEDWEEVQRRLSEKPEKPADAPPEVRMRNPYLLKKILFCFVLLLFLLILITPCVDFLYQELMSVHLTILLLYLVIMHNI